MLKILLTTAGICISLCIAKAQLAVSGFANATELAQKIVGPGLVVTNAVYKGTPVAAGIFSTMPGTNFSIANGIVLTSGKASAIPGSSAGVAVSNINNTSGDADLSALSSSTTLDAFVLEFDFVPQGTELNVKFTFGSEEYPTYNCCFNDPFGFFITSITGTDYTTPTNIALVPDTKVPVSINSINDGTYTNPTGSCDRKNCTGLGPGAPYTSFYIKNTNGSVIKYNGYTTNLFAKTTVVPCQTYHIKLAIADAGDNSYDSGVFIEAGSFKSEGNVELSTSGPVTIGTETSLVEGCKDGLLLIKRKDPTNTDEFDLQLNFSGSTASNNTDLTTPIPTTIHFNSDDKEITIPLSAPIDGIAEGDETLVVNIEQINPCTGMPSLVSTTQFIIKDKIEFNNTENTYVCTIPGSVLTGPAEAGETNTWKWAPGGQVTQDININTPGVYTVDNTYLTTCHNIKTITVENGDPTVSITSPQDFFCTLQSLALTAQGTPANYLWSNNQTTQSIQVNTGGTYTVKATSANGCYKFDQKTITQKPIPTIKIPRNTTLCTYQNIVFDISYPNATYAWYTWQHNFLSTSPSITAYPTDTLIAQSTIDGCTISDTAYITQKIMPKANAGPDQLILTYGSARLTAETCACNASYLWTPNNNLTNPTAYNAIASPMQSTTYYLQTTSPHGCVLNDTIKINVTPSVPQLPNVFSPNGDGVHDTWDIGIIRTYIDSRFQVFNRYGQEVFSSHGYQTNWDGTYKGKPLPIGTYYYILDPRNGQPVFKGSVTLLR